MNTYLKRDDSLYLGKDLNKYNSNVENVFQQEKAGRKVPISQK